VAFTFLRPPPRHLNPANVPDPDGLFPAERGLQFPALASPVPLPDATLGTVIVTVDADGSPHYFIGRHAGSLADICNEISVRVARSGQLPVHPEPAASDGNTFLTPALTLSIDTRARTEFLEPLLHHARQVGIRTLLIKTVSTANAGQNHPVAGILWPIGPLDSIFDLVPIIDLDDQERIYLSGDLIGRGTDSTLAELKRRLASTAELETQAGGNFSPIVVRANPKSSCGRYLEIIALLRSLRFPIYSDWFDFSEDLPPPTEQSL
jgi:hypothetical protein